MYFQKPQKPKLLNRFNTSLNSQKQAPVQRVTQYLNTSREHADDGAERYRNHIKFLECRIQQSQATIQKLQLQAQSASNANARLNAQVLKLQRSNKNMLDKLYASENRIRQLEQQNNNQMLNQSIQKLQHELSMSQARKRNRTLQDFDNPQKSVKSNRKSMKTSQFLSNSSEQPSYRLTSLTNFFKPVPQIYSITINPTPLIHQEKKVDKSHTEKLQLAIYTLKKQQKQEQRKLMETIQMLNMELKTVREKSKMHAIDGQRDGEFIQVQKYQKQSDRIRKLEDENIGLSKILEQKNKQLLELQQNYQKQLTQAQALLTYLQISMKQITEQKDSQINQLQTEKNQYLQKLKELKQRHNKLQSSVVQTTNKMLIQKQQYEEQISKLQSKIDDLNRQNVNNRNAAEERQLQCLQLSQNLSKKQSELFEIKEKVKSQVQNYDKMEELKTKLENKASLLEEESKKNSNLLQKMQTLESLNAEKSQKQIMLSSNLSKANEQLNELQNQKNQKNKQISKLSTLIRRLQGDVAQKQQLLQTLTYQMLQIKQKLTTTKNDVEVQWIDEGCETETPNSEQPTIEQLQQHFSMILNQKQQQQSQIARQLENQYHIKQQLQKQVEKLHSELIKLEDDIQSKNKQIDELNETVARYQQEIRESKAEIMELRKNVEQLQEKQGYYMDYIDKIKAVDV